jgi:hypothetical protein
MLSQKIIILCFEKRIQVKLEMDVDTIIFNDSKLNLCFIFITFSNNSLYV